MSKSWSKYLTCAIACLGALSLAPIASAGEGGAAAAAAFTIDATTGNVSGAAVSAAVGKQDAFAGAMNDPAGVNANTAFALGSAGVINVTSVDQITGFTDVQGTADTQLGTNQENSFSSSAATVRIGSQNGDAIADLGPTTP
ncbi:hypothetical protein Xen7305DRAFT_00028190 [Xenococcus sp. PCC 7305]|uniref:hypothetical protein n=1 Tax=Xenococcus sp. PCC 7305 TaxID=102125 RepID=UPI0002ACF74C|nr:hypothetical protein [Xenococcus sp. PCC 7305]ELS03099.1 hypothetical protein Xen7305DRAFT_00028190 [Xenococcus sp. PCC 7305]